MAKRGRPPKNRTVEQASRTFRAEDYGIGPDGKPLPECPRKFFEDGSPNLGYFHWMLGRLSESLTSAAIAGDKLPASYKDAQAALLSEAEMVGFRPQQLFDRRSEGDKIEEAVSKLLDAPDSVLEIADDIVDVIRKEMDKVDNGCKTYIQDKCDELDEALYEAAQEAAQKAKKAGKWKKVLENLLHVRARAKMPVPVRVPGVAPQDCDSLRAAHPLRFAIYIGRSNMPQFRSDASKASDAILRFARHHCKMAVDIWAAENNCVWDPDGIKVHVPGIRYEGAIIVAPPGHGKPLSVNEKVLCGDGTYRRLGDIKVGDTVITHRGRPRKVLAVHEQGMLDCVEIKTWLGRTSIAATDHPFLTTEGWKLAGKLRPGDVLALVQKHGGDRQEACDAECRMAGYFVGDGNCTGGNARISCATPATEQMILTAADVMGFGYKLRPGYRSICKSIEFKELSRAPREWLKQIGLAGHGSHDKRVPEFVMKADNFGVAAFLAAYFECDGTVTKKGRIRNDCCIEYASVNRALLEDCQSLLLRFGISARIRTKIGKYKGKQHTSYYLALSSADECAKFSKHIPVVGPKAERIAAWCPERRVFDSEHLPDEVVSVTACGKHECRCLTVEEDHTFTVSDLVVHNSELGAHWAALRICNNPNEQGLIGHAQSGEAEKTLRYLRHCFDRETAVGRRVATMFPRIKLAKNENNVNSIKLEVGEVLKQPTVMAYGIRSKISGANASWIWFDDPVDQREVDSETDRDRTDRVMNGTWMTRLRGTKGTFHLTTTTLWHPDDANMRRIKLARQKKVWIYVSRQWCGGPTWYPSWGNRRHYGPLWPEMYPEEYLRKQYAKLKPSLYAACYGSDPRTDSDKLVRKLRYYDPHTKEHQEVLQSGLSKFYISVDPAATVRETSDPAGLLYAVWGDVTSKTQTETGVDVKRRPVIRILDARQFKATQTDLADEIALYSATQRVDHVIVETTAAFNATRELLQELHGIPSIGMPPTQNKSKGVRLRAVSVMMEDANTGPDVPPPVVEFPGVPNEKGEIVPDPRFDWFYRQIVDFGTGVSDHALDALTQLLILLGPDVGVGTGLVTEHIQLEMTRDSRVSRLLGMRLNREDRPDKKTAEVEDLEFLMGVQSL